MPLVILVRKWIYGFIIFLCANLSFADGNSSSYLWKSIDSNYISVSKSIDQPEGFRRLKLDPDSFGAWLRYLPVITEHNSVLLFNGEKKFNQLAHHSIIDIDVGKKDLQQCADAVMRLRAEYLFSVGKFNDIHFNFTSGDKAAWIDWKNGMRPVVDGNKVLWVKKADVNGSYENFRKYMDSVFMYAGSASLSRELTSVADATKILPGDLFIQGGFPGHAVVVLDVSVNQNGDRAFIVAQSYMPAQQIHILRNPKFWNGPWYYAKSSGKLITPEWIFNFKDLKRFKKAGRN